MIGLKVQEFARFLIGKANRFDLKSPAPVLERPDSKELRERILSLSTSEARRLGLARARFTTYATKPSMNARSKSTRKLEEK